MRATGIKTPAHHWTDIQDDRGGRYLAGIAGSNLACGIAVSLLWVLRVVRYRSPSSRGILPSVCVYVCVCVCVCVSACGQV